MKMSINKFLVDYLAVVIMNVIGQIQVPSIQVQIQVENVVWLLRPYTTFLQRTEQSSGKMSLSNIDSTDTKINIIRMLITEKSFFAISSA